MATRKLLSGSISLSEAARKDRNVLHTLEYPRLKTEFYDYIESHRTLLADIVAYHLSIDAVDVNVSPPEYWLHGSFNLCIPILIHIDESATSGSRTPQFVTLRFPLPCRVGEITNPGNSDEKINTEAAAYAWIGQNCPSVPIPKLYGFGLSTNKTWTNLDFLPWWLRWIQKTKRLSLSLFRLPQPSSYVFRRSGNHLSSLDVGYLLIESITTGQMLSSIWDNDEKRNDEHRQTNLQRSLARIMLSLARIPLPRIGSFRLGEDGYLSLDNRPLSVELTMLENEGILSGLSRDTTFSRVDDLVHSRINTLDNRLMHQPNAIKNDEDAWFQMTSLAAARSTLPQLLERDLNEGPFVFALNDLHRSNIFVDGEWNITNIIDLEFAGSLPAEFIQAPYWLSGKLIDEIELDSFEPVHDKYLGHLRHEQELQSESDSQCGSKEPLSSIMQRAWSSGGFWVPIALLDSITFTRTFYYRILPQYFSVTDDDISNGDYPFFAKFWRPDVPNIIQHKLKDRHDYLDLLNSAFSANR